MPRAENFPRDTWHDRVRVGYEYYARSGRTDLEPPPIHQAVSYFESRAPEMPRYPQPADADNPLRAAFVVEEFAVNGDLDLQPAISNLRWTRLREGPHTLIVCDMRNGRVVSLDPLRPGASPKLVGRSRNPCHVEPCDLDADGKLELLVADLGSLSASDHDRGQVVLYRQSAAPDTYEQVILASGLGRVADVRPADLDADGDPDLVVAEFGHYLTGRITLLRNVSRVR